MRHALGRPPLEDDSAEPPKVGCLGPGEAHVFTSDPEHQSEAAVESAFRLLDEEERERAGRFLFPVHRRLFVVAHGLLRRALASYLGEMPERLKFRRTESGRPELETHSDLGRVRFSLSHTRGLVGCAIARDSEIGFDVEEIRSPAPIAIADRYFSKQELSDLRAVPVSQRDPHFFALWTLKEAYLKARSLGLSGGLGTFTTRYAAEGSQLVSCETEGKAASEWTLRSLRFPGHFAALAIRHPSPSLRVSLFPIDEAARIPSIV